MTALRVLLLVFALAATASSLEIIAGSGNCDGADYNCVNSPPLLRSYNLKTNPLILEAGSINMSIGGLPSWTRTAGDCLFVTVTDTHYVLSYQVSAGSLTLKSNVTLAPGINPVHLDTRGGVMAVANYHGPDTTTEDDGTAGVSTLKVGDECTLSFSEYVPHHGRSVNPGRQGASHVHSVNFLRGEEEDEPLLFFACDLGADTIVTYKADPTTAKIKETSRHNTTLGSGPRHMAFHPKLDIAYTVFEMGNMVVVYQVSDDGLGVLTEVQRASTMPSEHVFSGYSKAAEILISHDGSQLLVSNRGYGPDSGSVVVYAIGGDGHLNTPGVSTQVGDSYPRGMALLNATADPSSPRPTLAVAGQSLSSLALFTVEESGALQKSAFTPDGPPNPTTVSALP